MVGRGGTGPGNVSTAVDVSGQGGAEGVSSEPPRLGPVPSAGDGFGHVGEGGDESAMGVWSDFARLGVDHGSEFLTIDAELAQHCGQHPLLQFASSQRILNNCHVKGFCGDRSWVGSALDMVLEFVTHLRNRWDEGG